MMKHIIAAALLILGCSTLKVQAQTCASYTYTLQNGQVADANQVMANFNTIRNCVNNNALAKSNNLSDVTSPATSRSNLGLGAAATEGLSNASAGQVKDDGAGNLVTTPPVLHLQIIGATGSFTIPALATSATTFEFDVVGGGGGGGAANGVAGGGGGGSAACVGLYSGFTAGQVLTVTIGAGGGGAAGGFGGNGSGGGSSTVANGASAMVVSSGGNGGPGGANTMQGGGQGACVQNAAGLNLLASYNQQGQPGTVGYGTGGAPFLSGNGGASPFGAGGAGSFTTSSSTSISGGAGTLGGGGAGGIGNTGNGGTGGGGQVIVRWAL